MSYFEYLIKFPTLCFILLGILIVKNKDKFSFLFPNNDKRLERLLKSKEISVNKSKTFDEFASYTGISLDLILEYLAD